MDLTYFDVAKLIESFGVYFERWAGTAGLTADAAGFAIITISAFIVRRAERRAADGETKSGVYVHMLEQMLEHAPRERRALSALSDRPQEALGALDERLKGQGDWYREQRDHHKHAATKVRALGIKMEGRALGWGAGLIIIGTALQFIAGLPD